MSTKSRPRLAWLSALIVAVSLVGTATPVDAQLLPPLFGGGGSGSGGGTTTTTTTSTTTPPAGGTLIEGESLTPGTVIASSGAHGGRYLRTLGATASPGTGAGFHEVTVRAKRGTAARLRVVVDGAIVAADTLSTGWTLTRAVVRLPSSASTVRVESEALPWQDRPSPVDVDWIHVAQHEPVYTATGTQIQDLSGSSVIPRGVTFPGYQAPRSVDGRLELLPTMATEQHAWGVTAVRIPMNQEHWLANCSSTKGGSVLGYRAAVADEVERLTAKGVMVILTLTRTERGRATNCAPAGMPVFKEMADVRSLAFWRSVANQFRTDPLVAFDLFNEPHSISDAIWRQGGTVTYRDHSGLVSRTATYEAVGMQDLYDVVRRTGADNLVFVSGNRWASDPRSALTHPLDGYGIVLAVHTYCHSCPSPTLHPQLDVLVSPEVLRRYPVMITETGWAQPWKSTYNRRFIDWAEARGLGWTIYGWAPPGTVYSVLATWAPASRDAGDGTMTFAPSWGGAPVWNDLADVRVSRGFLANPVPEN